jgi:shikimate dehydrogenase
VRVTDLGALAPGRLGVLGWPVFHSRSPAMQRAAFAALGLRGWTYQHLPVPPELFVETVRALGAAGFVGANVTVPHKHVALALADSATPAARAIGAANTLSFLPDGSIAVDNTDAPGMLAAIGTSVAGRSAVVLGAGGTARAAAWALRDAGASVAVWNRSAARAQALARDLGVTAIARPHAADLLVNTTTVGMDECMSRDDVLTTLALDSDLLSRYAQVVDFVYATAPTVLVSAARERGVATVDGLEILVAQGALSFARWTGLVAPLGPMRRVAEGGDDV